MSMFAFCLVVVQFYTSVQGAGEGGGGAGEGPGYEIITGATPRNFVWFSFGYISFLIVKKYFRRRIPSNIELVSL